MFYIIFTKILINIIRLSKFKLNLSFIILTDNRWLVSRILILNFFFLWCFKYRPNLFKNIVNFYWRSFLRIWYTFLIPFLEILLDNCLNLDITIEGLHIYHNNLFSKVFFDKLFNLFEIFVSTNLCISVIIKLWRKYSINASELGFKLSNDSFRFEFFVFDLAGTYKSSEI